MRVGSSGPARPRRRAVGPQVAVPDQSKQWQADGQASSIRAVDSLRMLGVDRRVQFGCTPSHSSGARLSLNLRKIEPVRVEVTVSGADHARAMNAPKCKMVRVGERDGKAWCSRKKPLCRLGIQSVKHQHKHVEILAEPK